MSAQPLPRTPEHDHRAAAWRDEDGWRLAIVAAQPLMRDLLSRWLGRLGPCSVTALTDGTQLELLIGTGKALDAVVIGGLGTPWRDMLAALPEADRLGGLPVIVVPDHDEPELVAAALRKGVRGVVPTSLEPAVAAAAVRLVLSGGTFMPAHPQRQAAPQPTLANPAEVFTGLGLTRREAEVMALLQKGRSNRAIADALGISESTVVVHVRNLMQKLAATNRAQAVYKAHQRLRGGEAGAAAP